MKNLFKTHRWLSVVIAIDLILVLFLVDQISKWVLLENVVRPALPTNMGHGMDFLSWITALHLPRYDFVSLPVFPFFNLVMVWNQGISFGFFNDHPSAGNGILLITLTTIILGFSIWMIKTHHYFVRFVLAIIIGGAFGNLWDRVRFGAVADFFDFHAFGFHYPAFNVADMCIVMGIFALLGYELLSRHR